MQAVMNFKRPTALKVAAAAGLALALAGADGSAIAMSPIITPPINWAGGAEFAFPGISGGPFQAFAVPAGQNLILTDLVIGNKSGVQAEVTISQGTGGTCIGSTGRMFSIIAPTGQTTIVSLQTGIGFGAGKSVCLQTNVTVALNGRGFLFTAAPPG